MTKDEFATYLTENGFSTSIEDGVVMITLDHVPSTAEIKQMLDLKEQSGYNSSFGWQTRKQDKK